MSKTRQTAWVRVLSYDYGPGHQIPVHQHEEHQLIYAQRGVMTVANQGGVWVVPPQRAVWVPRGQSHSIRMSGRVEMRTLYLNTRAILPSCEVIEVSPLLRELVLDIVRLGGLNRSKAVDRSRFVLLKSELQAAELEGMSLRWPEDERLQLVVGRLREAPNRHGERGYLLSGTGLSFRTLERLCVEETGISYGRYARQVRMMRALELLALGQSVTSVGLECGYEGTSAFIASFRRAFGVTPGRYFESSRG